jgi:hypothetical protein
MIDRHGKKIIGGWDATAETYLSAILTLPRGERAMAYQELADMLGTSAENVRRRANDLRFRQRLMGGGLAAPAARAVAWPRMKSSLPPSELNTGARFAALRMGAK